MKPEFLDTLVESSKYIPRKMTLSILLMAKMRGLNHTFLPVGSTSRANSALILHLYYSRLLTKDTANLQQLFQAVKKAKF